MKKSKFILVGLSLLMILSLLVSMAACKTADPEPTATPTPTTTPTAAPTTTPTTTPTVAPTTAPEMPKYGGILRMPITRAPAGFDMNRRPSYGPPWGYLVFNSLVRYDPLNGDHLNPQNLIGDLAKTWEVSADGLVYTFNLEQGVKWHDGTPFTADDVVYSIGKFTDSTRSSIASYFPTYDRAEKVDTNTVKVYLNNPSPSFLIQIAGPYTNIQPKHLADVDWKTDEFMVGTGPFMLKEYTSGVGGSLVRNPDYFKKDANGNQLPYLDGVEITVMSKGAQIDAFIAENVDMGQIFGGMTTQEQLDRVKSQAPEAIIQANTPPQGTLIWFNHTYEPLKDARVRRALALVMQPEELITAAYGSPGFGNFDYAIFGSQYAMSKAEHDQLRGLDMPRADRIAEAQKLMAEAGYADGFPLRMVTFNLPEYERMYTLLADVWQSDLNIQTDIQLYSFGEALKERGASNFDVFASEMTAASGDPDEVASYFSTGNFGNFMKYSNPAIDDLFVEVSLELDMAKRIALTKQIETLILEDTAVTITRGTVFMDMWYPYVKNFVYPNVVYGSYMMLENVWLDK